MKKFELTNNRRTLSGVTLHQIVATKSFGSVREGDLGGWIESEANLSQEGECWIADEACVFGNARVLDNGMVSGNALVAGNALVYDKAIVTGNAKVYGDAQIYGEACIFDDAQVHGKAFVAGEAQIFGYARIYGRAFVNHDAVIYGNARVYGRVTVDGWARVGGNACISSQKHIVYIAGASSRYETITGYLTKTGEVEIVEPATSRLDKTSVEYEALVWYIRNRLFNR